MKHLKSFVSSYALVVFLLICCCFCFNLPKDAVERLRYFTLSSFIPSWTKLASSKNAKTKENNKHIHSDKLQQLTLENRLLHEQIDALYEWLLFEERFQEQKEMFQELSSIKKYDTLYWDDFFRRRTDELRRVLEIELQSIPAKVIFREPSSWYSTLWVNVGEKQNQILERTIIAENSPVVIGDHLVGLVEYVGEKCSRVRLITDSGLTPSVRAVRGALQKRAVAKLAMNLQEQLRGCRDLFDDAAQEESFNNGLEKLRNIFIEDQKMWYLAKGEVHGSSQPLWRGKHLSLQGCGFNYEYEDEEGSSRDLRTGETTNGKSKEAIALLKEGDHLLTTGYDGIFPAGLQVGIVSKVYPLREGDYYYRLEAKPMIPDMDEMKVLFIMPPLNYDVK